MRTAGIIVLAFILLVIQSSFAHLVPFDMIVPSLALPIILHMGLHDYNVAHGAIVCFVIGYLMDSFAGSPMGLYTFISVAAFLFSRLASLRLFLHGWIFEIAITFMLALGFSFSILFVRALFDQDFSSLLTHLDIVLSRAAATAIVAPVVFRATNRIENITPRKRGVEGRVLRG
jgi:rod shape-determining protein MreD